MAKPPALRIHRTASIDWYCSLAWILLISSTIFLFPWETKFCELFPSPNEREQWLHGGSQAPGSSSLRYSLCPTELNLNLHYCACWRIIPNLWTFLVFIGFQPFSTLVSHPTGSMLCFCLRRNLRIFNFSSLMYLWLTLLLFIAWQGVLVQLIKGFTSRRHIFIQTLLLIQDRYTN